MKEDILLIILIVLEIGAGFYAGMYVGKDQTEDRYAAAPHHRDTTIAVKETPLPPQTITAKPKPKLTPEHKINADSIYNYAYAIGASEARALFEYYTAPRETLVTFDSIGTLQHLSDRLREMEIYTFKPFPRIEIERTITDSIYVNIREEREWWRTPAWVMGSFAVGWIAHDNIKN